MLFRSQWNRNLSAHDPAYFLSAEDLTIQAGLALQQDLALVSLLGIAHVERNGHHYVNGMAALPEAEQAAFLHAHPDLAQHGRAGTVGVVDGVVGRRAPTGDVQQGARGGALAALGEADRRAGGGRGDGATPEARDGGRAELSGRGGGRPGPGSPEGSVSFAQGSPRAGDGTPGPGFVVNGRSRR